MKIEKIKKTGKKYKIVLDNDLTFTTYDDVLINNGLLYNKEIDQSLLNEIVLETSFYDIYYKCVNYITKKLRSEKEISEYIDSYNVLDTDKSKTILKLKSIGLINDTNYAKAYISDKINLSSDGPIKIKNELLKHNIDSNIIDEIISNIDPNINLEKIKKLIIKKTKNSKYTGYTLKQKVVNDLINLGYDKSDVLNIYDNLDIKDSSQIDIDYDKFYKKYSLKYTGYELNKKIKSKLYQKGYSMDMINDIVK